MVIIYVVLCAGTWMWIVKKIDNSIIAVGIYFIGSILSIAIGFAAVAYYFGWTM